MSLSLYDPATQSLVPVPAESHPSVLCGHTEGPSGLSELRQRTFQDVLARQLLFGACEQDGVIAGELGQFLERALPGACEPESLRYWLLSTHYREPLSLAQASDDAAEGSLEVAERQLDYLYATKKRLLTLPRERIIRVQTPPPETLASCSDTLTRALEADLDTPKALAALHGFLIAVNALCDTALRKHGRVNASAVDSALAGFSTATGALALGGDSHELFLERSRDRRAARMNIDVRAVQALVAKRADARAARDFAGADRLQVSLQELGVSLLDGPHGTSWTC